MAALREISALSFRSVLTRIDKKKSGEASMTRPWKASTMMDRRQFIYAGATGLALSARIPKAFAATYDVLIKGGRVIDPSAGLDAVRDLAISGGKIVAVAENIT